MRKKRKGKKKKNGEKVKKNRNKGNKLTTLAKNCP